MKLPKQLSAAQRMGISLGHESDGGCAMSATYDCYSRKNGDNCETNVGYEETWQECCIKHPSGAYRHRHKIMRDGPCTACQDSMRNDQVFFNDGSKTWKVAQKNGGQYQYVPIQ
jgi:hypothetical protein